MDFKLPSRICCYVLCVSLIITYVFAQPPPPPEVPTDLDQIQLDSTIPDKTNTASALPECTDIICTMEYIPEECREKPVLQRNGINCTGCNQWKEMCKKEPNLTKEILPVDVTCPIVSCPNIKIPTECVVVETYLFLGKTCDKCPTRKADCPANVIVNNEVLCPVQACTLQLIPTECRDVPTFDYNGITCNGCPQWRPGCQPMGPGNRLFPRIACPLIACDSYIPDECRIEQKFQYGGQMCDKCPTWREGCREAERRSSFISGPVDHLGNRVRQTPCPRFPCRELNVPTNCIQEEPYQYRGVSCFKCPTVRPECQSANNMELNQITSAPEIPCPFLKCDRRAGIPSGCYQPEQYIYRGKVCQGCPSIKLECRMAEPPRPIVAVDPMLSGRRDTPEIPCPMMACPLIYIPPECRDVPTYQINGKTCQQCPVFREGCMPALASPIPTPKTVFPEIPPRQPNVRCPVRACPMNDIPSECRVEQSYQYQGMLCYDCPTWRESCRQRGNVLDRIVDVPQVDCPMFGCTRIYIPAECREEQTFQLRGLTCKMCPKWREGCIPSGNRIIVDPVSPQSSTPRIPPVDQRVPEKACPMLACPKIYIPTECRQEQPYDFEGKTCYKCPTWREGCIPSGNRIAVDPVSPPSSTPRIPPVDQRVPEKACPMLACPKIYIPTECRQEQSYNLDGKTCYKCPTWREGCIPSGNRIVVDPVSPQSSTPRTPPVDQRVPEKACPMLACPMIYIPTECRQEQPYDLDGKTCYKCPTWREGCSENGGLTGTTTQSSKVQEFTIKNPSPSLTDLKGVIPVTRIIDTVNAASCPALRCPDMFIPLICREETTYVYQERTCRGCPRWRLGCNPMNNTPFNTNPNGILSFSLFNELFAT